MDEDRLEKPAEDRFARARSEMIQRQLVHRGVSDRRVLDAMRCVPREMFVSQALQDSAYDDRALPSEAGQTISQPYIVAYMTERIDIQPDHRVLEIGTGAGYQTAILAQLCGHVVTIERITRLSASAQPRLAALGITNVTYIIGDGSLGSLEFAPYDRIIVTAAAPKPPAALVEQLVENGRIIVPVGKEQEQQLVMVERRRGRLVETRLIPVRFVRLIGKDGWPAD